MIRQKLSHLEHAKDYYSLSLSPEDRIPADLAALGIHLPPAIARSVSKRQMDFILGRYCAKVACAQAGMGDVGTLEIAKNRAPIWPIGLVGSITHCDGFVAAVVASQTELLGIGIDAEPIFSERTLNSVRDVIALPSEAALALKLKDVLSDVEFHTVLFSAKESIYKCLQPLCEPFIGFHDVRITAVDAAAGLFSFETLVDLSSELPKGFRHHGTFVRDGGLIHTAVELERSSTKH